MEKKSLITKKAKDAKTEIGKEKKTVGRSYRAQTLVSIMCSGTREMAVQLSTHRNTKAASP